RHNRLRFALSGFTTFRYNVVQIEPHDAAKRRLVIGAEIQAAVTAVDEVPPRRKTGYQWLLASERRRVRHIDAMDPGVIPRSLETPDDEMAAVRRRLDIEDDFRRVGSLIHASIL